MKRAFSTPAVATDAAAVTGWVTYEKELGDAA